MTHDHSHQVSAATATGAYRRRLAIVLAITLTVMVAEFVGAIVSGSVALLADAGHMLTDSAGIAIALLAAWLATHPTTAKRTFGWQRAEILAALGNGLLLVVISVLVIVEGSRRVFAPAAEIESGVMLIVATVGLVANLVSLAILASGRNESLNVKGAYLEVLGDALGSIAVIVAGLVIWKTGFMAADGIASIVIGLMILPRAVTLIREVGMVLLEATPVGVDLDEVRAHILGIDEVVAVHDLHAWTITSGVPVMSAHVVVTQQALDGGGAQAILEQLRTCLAGHFDLDHCTFQIESPEMRESEVSNDNYHP